MKRNYANIIDAMLGVLFVLLLLGFAQSICFLDYQMAYFEPDCKEFATILFRNNYYMIGFTSASLVICVLYGLFDIFKWKHSSFVQTLLGILLMGISAYMFILLCGLRDMAFNIENAMTAMTFPLYKEYRLFSLEIILSQFLIALHALIRSVHDAIKKVKTKENESI